MPLSRDEIVEQFAAWAASGELGRSYVMTGRDEVALAALMEAVIHAVDPTGADTLTVAPDGASLGIAKARDAREHLGTHPGVAPFRVAGVHAAHLLTEEAQNALLKVAEEPAERAVLILATSDEQRLLPTLRSRLYRIALAGDAGTGSGEQARAFAKALLAARPAEVPPLTKQAATDEITLKEALRALSEELAYTARTERTIELWHRVQRLTAQAEASPLSLRLQINALFTDLPA